MRKCCCSNGSSFGVVGSGQILGSAAITEAQDTTHSASVNPMQLLTLASVFTKQRADSRLWVQATFAASMINTVPSVGVFHLRVAAVDYAASGNTFLVAGSPQSGAVSQLIVGVPAGTPAIQLMWAQSINGAGLSVRPSTGVEHATLMVQEWA